MLFVSQILVTYNPFIYYNVKIGKKYDGDNRDTNDY